MHDILEINIYYIAYSRELSELVSALSNRWGGGGGGGRWVGVREAGGWEWGRQVGGWR